MMPNFKNWYWIVSSTERVYSSASNTYVLPTDAAYTAWEAEGNRVNTILSEAELWDVVRVPLALPSWLFNGTTFVQPASGTYTQAQLADYAASVRYDKETGGTTVSGTPIPTDRTTQSLLTGAYSYVQATPSATVQWKLADGTFVNLTAAQITEIAVDVAGWVQQCFAKEAAAVASINAGTITTLAAVDAALA